MSSLTQKSLRILLGRGSVAVLSLGVTIFFAYEMPKVIFAFIALYDTVVSLSKVVTDLGLHFQVLRDAPSLYYSDRRNNAIDDLLIPASAARTVASGAVTLTVLLIVAGFYEPIQTQFPEFDLTFVIVIAACHLLIENLQGVLTPLYIVIQRFGTNSFLESSILLAESILSLVLFLVLGIDYYFVGLLSGQLIIFAIRLMMIRSLLFHRRWKVKDLTVGFRLMRQSYPFYLRKFFRMGMVQAEALLIAAMLPIQQVANYRLAKKSSSFLKNYIAAFIDPLIVKLSRSNEPKDRHRFAFTYYSFTLPLPVALALASPWIMPLVGGHKYADSWPILAILFVSYVFAAISALQLAVMTTLGQAKDMLIRDAIAGMVGLVSTFFCILWWQESGIAWGQVLSQFVMVVAGHAITRRILDSTVAGRVSAAPSKGPAEEETNDSPLTK